MREAPVLRLPSGRAIPPKRSLTRTPPLSLKKKNRNNTETMSNILDHILEEKRREVADERENTPVEQLRRSPFYTRERLSMSRSILRATPCGIIAEFKRCSPSKGFIRPQADPAEIVPAYARAGAAACSVLTDRKFFAGSADDLFAARRAADIPLLRKDFVIDPYQLHQAAAWGADAVLLIAAALGKDRCRELARTAADLGLEVLLEIHTQDELVCLCPEITMVGINNRDLRTFRTDVQTSLTLVRSLPRHVVRVSESGIDSPETVSKLRAAGFDGFLIGECFMRRDDPADALRTFLSHAH